MITGDNGHRDGVGGGDFQIGGGPAPGGGGCRGRVVGLGAKRPSGRAHPPRHLPSRELQLPPVPTLHCGLLSRDGRATCSLVSAFAAATTPSDLAAALVAGEAAPTAKAAAASAMTTGAQRGGRGGSHVPNGGNQASAFFGSIRGAVGRQAATCGRPKCSLSSQRPRLAANNVSWSRSPPTDGGLGLTAAAQLQGCAVSCQTQCNSDQGCLGHRRSRCRPQ